LYFAIPYVDGGGGGGGGGEYLIFSERGVLFVSMDF
jgi:hypothetical protein